MSNCIHDHSRWGPGDQLGAGHLLTPEATLAALALVTQGRNYDMSHVIEMGAPRYGAGAAALRHHRIRHRRQRHPPAPRIGGNERRRLQPGADRNDDPRRHPYRRAWVISPTASACMAATTRPKR